MQIEQGHRRARALGHLRQGMAGVARQHQHGRVALPRQAARGQHQHLAAANQAQAVHGVAHAGALQAVGVEQRAVQRLPPKHRCAAHAQQRHQGQWLVRPRLQPFARHGHVQVVALAQPHAALELGHQQQLVDGFIQRAILGGQRLGPQRGLRALGGGGQALAQQLLVQQAAAQQAQGGKQQPRRSDSGNTCAQQHVRAPGRQAPRAAHDTGATKASAAAQGLTRRTGGAPRP